MKAKYTLVSSTIPIKTYLVETLVPFKQFIRFPKQLL